LHVKHFKSYEKSFPVVQSFSRKIQQSWAHYIAGKDFYGPSFPRTESAK